LGAPLLVLSACDGVSFVDQVTIVNDTSYPATVGVRGESGGWLALATVETDETRDVKQVIDQGESWVFRFAYGPHDPVEMEMSRQELVDANWRVAVPSEFEEELRNEGVPPPP
jgi:hypothetical protein